MTTIVGLIGELVTATALGRLPWEAAPTGGFRLQGTSGGVLVESLSEEEDYVRPHQT